MTPNDVLSPNLAGERRVWTGDPVIRRVYSNDFYEVFAALYPGGLLATMVHYRRENLRIMSRLGESPALSDERDAWVQACVDLLIRVGKTPLHVVLDSKLECRLPVTLHDRAALKMGGIVVPKSAGRYREMFGQPR